jgi:hypothetical protein
MGLLLFEFRFPAKTRIFDRIMLATATLAG